MPISRREIHDALLDTEVVDKVVRQIRKQNPNITKEELEKKIDKVACGGMGGASHPTAVEDLITAELKHR
jgi:hypothetical protein